jgi:hypothetical protein
MPVYNRKRIPCNYVTARELPATVAKRCGLAVWARNGLTHVSYLPQPEEIFVLKLQVAPTAPSLFTKPHVHYE